MLKRSIKFWKLLGGIRMAEEKLYNGVIYYRGISCDSIDFYVYYRKNDFIDGLLELGSKVFSSFWVGVERSKSDLCKLLEERENG